MSTTDPANYYNDIIVILGKIEQEAIGHNRKSRLVRKRELTRRRKALEEIAKGWEFSAAFSGFPNKEKHI